MTQETVQGFFSGGGKGAKFPQIGATVSGTVTAVHPPEPQRDIATNQPIPDKIQVRIDLATKDRDPEIDGDDGSRTLYVRGWMRGAVGDALRRAGANEPAIGGTLTVTYSGDGTATRPGFDPPKLYTATYVPPSSPVAQHFSVPQTTVPSPQDAALHTPAQQANGGPVKPDTIPQNLWDAMDLSTRQAVATTVGVMAGPVKPDGLDQTAWDRMDSTTKQAVANTMAQLPPF